MKLTHPYYLEPIEITEETPVTLIIERGDHFRRFVSELIVQTKTGIGDFVLSEGNEIIALNKNAIVISDVLDLDFDSRPIKTRLLQEIVPDCDEEQINEIINSLNLLGATITNKSKYSLTFNMNLSTNDLLKILDFQFDTETYSDVERIFEYIEICAELLGKKPIFIVGLKDLLTDEEFLEIKKLVEYKKQPVFLIEHRQHRTDDRDHSRIIDEDLCSI